MFNLMLKDILIQKKMFLFSALYIVVMLAVFSFGSSSVDMFPVIIVAVTYMLLLGACALDDKNKADIMLNSLPASKAKIVGARYLVSFVFLLWSAGYYVIITALIGIFDIPVNIDAVNMQGFLGALITIALLISIYLPVFFKVGYTKSRILNLIVFFVFFFTFNMIIESMMKNNDSKSMDAISAFIQNQSVNQISLLILGFASILLVISYGIALKIYKNREF